MAKKVKVKEHEAEPYAGHKGPMPGMEVSTPYPKDHKKIKPDEIDFLGNKLANLNERVNEVELSIESLRLDLKRVMGRMGL